MMRRRFWKNMAVVIAVSVAVSMCGITSFAVDYVADNSEGATTDVASGKTMNNNEGTVTTNEGTIKNNEGTVTTNDGTVTNNKEDGEVITNNGEVKNNEGTVDKNTEEGRVSYNKEGGEVTTNEGLVSKNEGTVGTNIYIVTVNSSGGTIVSNKGNGEVATNKGIIENNEAGKMVPDENNGGKLKWDTHGVDQNHGTIIKNSGVVGDNGVDGSNKEDSSAIIQENSGYVIQNGDYREVDSEIEPDEKAVVINTSKGTVEINNGIVENYGTVKHNNGIVYNYGGTITGEVDGKGPGTEYFSVSVTSSEKWTTAYGTGFTEYKETNWLGQSYSSSSGADSVNANPPSKVTVTPSSGYQISELNIPSEYSKYVSATQNSDGSWILSVSSGYNIKLTPTATLIGGNSSGSTDPTNTNRNNSGSGNNNSDVSKTISLDVYVDSDSDSGNESRSNPEPTVAEPVAQSIIMPQLTINSFGIMGQELSLSVSDVLQSVDNITAMNNFTESGAPLPPSENIMACGIVDFNNAFANVSNGTIDVPISANVVPGETYTVALSDGTTIQVTCTANGVLNIPFAANAQNLTFIICGIPANPAMMIGSDTSGFTP